MSLAERQALYNAIEAHRKRPLVAFVTSGRPGANGMIAQDAVREFADQLKTLPAGASKLDVLINSYGGDGLASWRLVTMIREHLGPEGKLACLVPYYAFSAATLFAVGCDQILLHPMAALGPVDPQITVNRPGGMQQFAYEDVSAYTSFLKEEAGITEQPQKSELLSQLVKQIEPSVIGASKRASMQSIVMAERLLKLHMKGEDAAAAEVIAQKLSKNYFSHGHALGRSEAQALGLNLAEADPKLEDLLWKVYVEFEGEMQMNKQFDPSMEYLADPGAAPLLAAPPFVNVPSNAPPQVVQQIWNQVMQASGTSQGPVLDFELVHAAVESSRLSTRFVTRGKIFGARQPDLNFRIAAPKLAAGWESSR
jgi:hypothetical protein